MKTLDINCIIDMSGSMSSIIEEAIKIHVLLQNLWE